MKPSSQLGWISPGLQKELYLLVPKLPMARDVRHVREAIVAMNQKPRGTAAECVGQEGTLLESS